MDAWMGWMDEMVSVSETSCPVNMVKKIKWNEWGFRPSLCTYRPTSARRTSWGWWDECDDTALQTQDSKFEPWRSEAEYAASRSQRLTTILNLYKWAGEKHFFSLKLEVQSGVRIRALRLSKQAALTTAPGPLPRMVAPSLAGREPDPPHTNYYFSRNQQHCLRCSSVINLSDPNDCPFNLMPHTSFCTQICHYAHLVHTVTNLEPKITTF